MKQGLFRGWLLIAAALLLAASTIPFARQVHAADNGNANNDGKEAVGANALQKVDQGRNTFRFDTFGDEAFWGVTLMLHLAIEGSKLGGIGPGVSPTSALLLGLKVDVDALPHDVQEKLKHGKINLDDPATTLALMQMQAVVG